MNAKGGGYPTLHEEAELTPSIVLDKLQTPDLVRAIEGES